MYYPELKNLTMKNLLKTSWDVFRIKFNKLALYLGIFSLLHQTILFIIFGPVLEGIGKVYPLIFIDVFFISLIDITFSLTSIFLNSILLSGVCIITEQYFKGEETNIIDVYTKTLKIIIKIIKTSFMQFTFVAIASLFFIIPGIILYNYIIFSLHEVVLRNKNGAEALSQSHKIVGGNWWNIFGYHTGLFLISFLLFFIYILIKNFLPSNISIDILLFILNNIFTSSFLGVTATIIFLKFESIYQINLLGKNFTEDHIRP